MEPEATSLPTALPQTMARKDVRLMIEAALDHPLAALPSLAARMDALIAAGQGGEGFAVLAIDAVR